MWHSTQPPALAHFHLVICVCPNARSCSNLRSSIHHMNMVLADLPPGSRNPFITMERKSK